MWKKYNTDWAVAPNLKYSEIISLYNKIEFYNELHNERALIAPL